MSQAQALRRTRPLVLVAVGGFLGAVTRHVVSASLSTALLGTLVVNVVGCFALGALLSEARLANALSAETRLVLGTGFLSSFTTYSAFAVQTLSLSPRLAVANVAATYAFGFLAVVLGGVVARWLS